MYKHPYILLNNRSMIYSIARKYVVALNRADVQSYSHSILQMKRKKPLVLMFRNRLDAIVFKWLLLALMEMVLVRFLLF